MACGTFIYLPSLCSMLHHINNGRLSMVNKLQICSFKTSLGCLIVYYLIIEHYLLYRHIYCIYRVKWVISIYPFSCTSHLQALILSYRIKWGTHIYLLLFQCIPFAGTGFGPTVLSPLCYLYPPLNFFSFLAIVNADINFYSL